MTQEYQQPERYCLMQYECETCKYVEPIWNSRNAVTPFIVACGVEGCEGHMQHVNWQRDQRHTDLPNQAARVFISITQEDAHRLAERKWMRFAEQGATPTTQGTRDEILAQWAEHIYGDGDQPYAVPRAEYLRRQAEGGVSDGLMSEMRRESGLRTASV